MRVLFSALLFLLVSTTPSYNKDESPILVKAEVDKATFTIGERVEYRVTVTLDPGIQILSSIAPPSEDTFEIKEAHDVFEKQGEKIVTGRRFILTTYQLGEFILKPVVIRYRTQKGEEKSVQTNRLYVTVRSVDASGKPKTDIRNVKGLMELKRTWKWLGFTLIFLVIAISGAIYWWKWKNRPLGGGGAFEMALSLEDRILLELNKLFDSDLLHKGKIKEYFLALSEILKRYFEARFQISAVESTTSEVLRDLKQKDVPKELCDKIEGALETADLVKFAKWRPAASEILKINQLAKNIIEEAKPKVGV